MKTNGKILNDPIYGLIEIPYGILFDLIEHRYYQRLRRINQLGFTHYVYPGATHSRFSHAMGALHLMQKAIRTLRSKGIEITDEEAEAVSIAILLHDIGHGPFSHSLEYQILPIEHEAFSIAFMEKLNDEFDGRLTMALQIFRNEYSKKFLHQLVSGQLDMDRMDYLTRDSFFTGVYEGVIGYDRIIKMLSVHEDELVIEYKGIYSVEKFLIARRLMYWQVYLHKTVICAGEMMIRFVRRAKELTKAGQQLDVSRSFHYFLANDFSSDTLKTNTALRDEVLYNFSRLDDIDVLAALKNCCVADDFILSYLAKSIVTRKLFRIRLQDDPIDNNYINGIKEKVLSQLPIKESDLSYILFTGQEENKAYVAGNKEIMILLPSGEVYPISQWREHNVSPKNVIKYYIAHPKNIEF